MEEKERDVESLYDYFGARYYDASIGRWLAVDPLSDEFPSWNPYNYCECAPLRLFDPTGEGPFDRANWGNVGKSLVSLAGYSGQMVTGAFAVVPSGFHPAVVGYTCHGVGGYIQSIGNMSNSFLGRPPNNVNIFEAVGGSVGGETGARLGGTADALLGAVSPSATLALTIEATAATIPKGIEAGATLARNGSVLLNQFKGIESSASVSVASDAFLRNLTATAKSDVTATAVRGVFQATSLGQAGSTAIGNGGEANKSARKDSGQIQRDIEQDKVKQRNQGISN